MDGHIMRCGTIGSCQSAATSEIAKHCWSRLGSLTHVSSAITSVKALLFTFDIVLVNNGLLELNTSNFSEVSSKIKYKFMVNAILI